MENKRKIAMIISTLGIFLIITGVTFAFFNYTRTGMSNSFRVGRIYFDSDQTNTITLLDVFPIDSSDVNTSSDVGTVTINITGDTEYSEGIEYLLTVTNLTNTINNKAIPIDVVVTGTGIGTSDDSYFTNRGGNTSIYKVLGNGTIENNKELLVGYITEGVTGVNGTVTIKAYIDKEKVAISDTYPEGTIRTVKTTGYSSSACETALTGVTNASTYCASASSLQDAVDNENLTDAQITLLVNAGLVEEYTDGTTENWVDGRTVLTTAEWNSLQSNGVSFQVKVEANEGTWVRETPICKRATTLHTETCSYTSGNHCYADGYYVGGTMNTTTITYGNLGTSGELHTGDAFDCNVDGTGYNKRFYYVSNYYDTSTKTYDNTTAVLIYSSNIVYDSTTNRVIDSYNGSEYYASANENWHGPVSAKANLPTTQEWSNVELKTTERNILACGGASCGGTLGTTNKGSNTIESFSYSGYAARLLTLMELNQAGCHTASGKSSLNKGGALTACNFLMEGTKYADSSKAMYGLWLETPSASYSDSVWYADTGFLYVDLVPTTSTSFGGVRPVIDVPMNKIEY